MQQKRFFTAFKVLHTPHILHEKHNIIYLTACNIHLTTCNIYLTVCNIYFTS